MDGLELRGIRLAEPLLCGMRGCDETTTSGLLEPDPQTHGLWRLLPVCVSCSTSLRDGDVQPRSRQPSHIRMRRG